MAKIFLSYRRVDARATAGRIFDRLTSRFGKRSVYIDIDNIPIGSDFRKAITNALNEGDIVLAIIGPRWRGLGEDGRARIFDEDDPVRIEIETALGRDLPILPVLVNGAKMPSAAELPESLREFAYCNAAEVDDGRDFHQHVDRVIRSVDSVLRAQRRLQGRFVTGRRGFIALGSIALALGVALSGQWLFRGPIDLNKKGTTGPPRIDLPVDMHGQRKALVIGMSNYQNVPKLQHSIADASAIGAMLNALGYITQIHHDLRITEFRRVVRDFTSVSPDAEIAVAFFSGHAIELAGENYLIPIDAALATNLDVQDEAISVERLVESLGRAGRLRLVLLDAARENAFGPKMRQIGTGRSVATGLAKAEVAHENLLIVHSAKPGTVAVDWPGPNSSFTSALLKHLGTPGLDIRLALGRVRDEVLRTTGNRQEPFVFGTLGGNITSLVPPAEKKRSQ
jgi:hypothetical protein